MSVAVSITPYHARHISTCQPPIKSSLSLSIHASQDYHAPFRLSPQQKQPEGSMIQPGGYCNAQCLIYIVTAPAPLRVHDRQCDQPPHMPPRPCCRYIVHMQRALMWPKPPPTFVPPYTRMWLRGWLACFILSCELVSRNTELLAPGLPLPYIPYRTHGGGGGVHVQGSFGLRRCLWGLDRCSEGTTDCFSVGGCDGLFLGCQKHSMLLYSRQALCYFC